VETWTRELRKMLLHWLPSPVGPRRIKHQKQNDKFTKWRKATTTTTNKQINLSTRVVLRNEMHEWNVMHCNVRYTSINCTSTNFQWHHTLFVFMMIMTLNDDEMMSRDDCIYVLSWLSWLIWFLHACIRFCVFLSICYINIHRTCIIMKTINQYCVFIFFMNYTCIHINIHY
jgi:hypothetical protein